MCRVVRHCCSRELKQVVLLTRGFPSCGALLRPSHALQLTLHVILRVRRGPLSLTMTSTTSGNLVYAAIFKWVRFLRVYLQKKNWKEVALSCPVALDLVCDDHHRPSGPVPLAPLSMGKLVLQLCPPNMVFWAPFGPLFSPALCSDNWLVPRIRGVPNDITVSPLPHVLTCCTLWWVLADLRHRSRRCTQRRASPAWPNRQHPCDHFSSLRACFKLGCPCVCGFVSYFSLVRFRRGEFNFIQVFLSRSFAHFNFVNLLRIWMGLVRRAFCLFPCFLAPRHGSVNGRKMACPSVRSGLRTLHIVRPL